MSTSSEERNSSSDSYRVKRPAAKSSPASSSFAKGTANNSGTDIDLFVSLASTTTNPLKELYDSLAATLQKAGYTPRRQNVSLGIRVGNYDVDMVPAKRQSSWGDDHSLYKQRADTWTKTNVAQHIALVSRSGRTEGIRIIKLWRKQKGIDFLSFFVLSRTHGDRSPERLSAVGALWALAPRRGGASRY